MKADGIGAAAGRAGPERATLVVAGISARTMAESAQRAGWGVIALDLFGDRDTRRASRRWLPIGDPATLAIDPARLRAALQAAGREPDVIGWVAGSGFEAVPSLLEAADALPLLGTPPQAVRALRDPRRFFGLLDRLDLPHPPVAWDPPVDPRGWLAKRAGGCGGWHIRRASAPGPVDADTYYQRLQHGEPMSALFLADGQRAEVVALNRLLVRPWDGHPFVYCGAVGPVVDDALQARVEAALAGLVPALGLRGLASLDFVAEGGTPWLLEVNARPSATMQLHERAFEGGLMRGHVQAHEGRLPAPEARRRRAGVRGARIVFASRPCRADAAIVEALARTPHCHDVPFEPARYERGQPVCSVSAAAADAGIVQAVLTERCVSVRARLLASVEHAEEARL